MFEKRKVWAGVGSALIATSVAAQPSDNLTVTPVTSTVVSFSSMGEGEGGEGEGEGSAKVDLRTDNSAYLARLGLIRGHLWVGMKLYREGHLAMAKTHMKHPEDELYAGLAPVFKARGVEGFADELSVLADAVNNEEGDKAVESAYRHLVAAISKSEQMEDRTAKEALLSISQMIRTAADEYAIGVKSGEVVNVHEYQDAYGFTEIAIQRLEQLSDEQKMQAASDIESTKNWLMELRSLWPTVDPKGNVEGDAKHLYGASARIELAALN
ncbi:hypothetical protein [Kangiella sediminilitoris]|uniref:Putative conserved secreted protein n=1 Tax=Kangiella sediminilitoris TaxID=1144748 RepID=A0A1B3BDI7_9GAMM|nr:hypothetical protein [Kangiella sediminilitoris]AOE50823.1 putative conserved secreted protein [Kangiella sediminilitoris]